ncbi:MAG: PfkB family carbohydrate kinase [Candidatus Omnitrophica bacterium]|nr:PfkB family carbohydrate kinase [Candidatus Omnitrophota bacterium]
MSTLVLGTVALDTVKTPFGLRKQILGGSAVHFAMSARLFVPVNLVAIVGKDFPQQYIDFLNRKGVILTSLIRAEGKTFKWQGEYKEDMEVAYTLNTELGVLTGFRPCLTEQQKKMEYIFLANIDPELQQHLLNHLYSPRMVALDSMNYWIEHKRKVLMRLLRDVDIYVANEEEARALSGELHLVKAAKRLRSLGPKMILIKRGQHGVLFYSDNFIFSIPAYPTEKIVDPTGAGDTFAGGFMGYLASKRRMDKIDLKRAVVYGAIAASFNVEDFGVNRTAKLTLKDLNDRLFKFKECVLF